MDHLPFHIDPPALCVHLYLPLPGEATYDSEVAREYAQQFARFSQSLRQLCDQSRDETGAQQDKAWIEYFMTAGFDVACQVILTELWLKTLEVVIGKDSVDVPRFLVRDKSNPVLGTLSTKDLQHLLQDWRQQVETLDRDYSIDLSRRIAEETSESAKVINSLSFFSELVCTMPDNPFLDSFEPIGATHTACTLMICAIRSAAAQSLSPFAEAEGPSLFWGPKLPYIEWRMLQREHWCRYTVARLFQTRDVEELALAYALGTVRTRQDHSLCSEQICITNNTADTDQSEPKHADNTCSRCATLVVPMDDVVSIIESGGVPIIRTREGPDHCMSITVHALKTNRPYIALSHVWADGLGCASSNAIKQCQLRRLHDWLGLLAANEQVSELYLWTDTLCIPVGKEHRVLRDSQVQKMNQVYQDAYAVLVMDPDLVALKEQAPYEEVVMRLVMSAWGSRLWTCQEGSLAARLLIMISDGMVDLDKYTQSKLLERLGNSYHSARNQSSAEVGEWKIFIRKPEAPSKTNLHHPAVLAVPKEAKEPPFAPDLQTKNQTTPSGHVPQHRMLESMIKATSNALGRPEYACLPPFYDLAQTEYTTAVPLSVTFFGPMECINSWQTSDTLSHSAKQELDARRNELRTQQMLHAIQWRNSSRSDDETIILGAGLGLNMTSILQSSPEQRMKVLLAELLHIPANLLFSYGSRLPYHGFRWAPRTVLQANGASVAPVIGEMIPLGNGGIQRPLSRLAPDNQGLLTFSMAIRLRWWYTTDDILVKFILPQSALFCYTIGSRAFGPTAVDEEGSKAIVKCFRSGKRLAILIPTFETGPTLTIGVLAELQSDVKYHTTIDDNIDCEHATKCQYIAPVCFGRKERNLLAGGVTDSTGRVTLAREKLVLPTVEPEGLDEIEVEDVTWEAKMDGRKDVRAEHRVARWLGPRWWLVD